MKSKKEQELLRDILAVLLKYDYPTIEHCLDHLMENKQKLPDFLAFVSGGESSTQSKANKSAADGSSSSPGKKKGVIVRRICKYLSGKRFTYEQVRHMSAQYFQKKPVSIVLDSDDKNELLSVLARQLADLPEEDIRDFEQYIQAQSKAGSENTLENWSKVIIKEPSE